MSADDSSKGGDTEASPSHDVTKRNDEVGGDAEVNLKRKAESPPPANSEDLIQKRQKKESSETDSSRVSPRESENPEPMGKTQSSPKERRNSRPHSSKANSPDESRRGSAQAPPDRRKNFAQEERKRGQRLFGGLLSTLNQRQTGSNSQQKKRLDVERRQQERANNQRIEDDKRRAKRLAKLKHSREIQQITFDEQVMHTRHATMLSQAKSLRTRSKPEIYYRPWEPSAAQERLILKQVKDAKDAIAAEIEQFKIQKAKRLADLGVALLDDHPADKTVGELADKNSNPTDADKSIEIEVDKSQHDDKEVVVETEEDTVIY